MIVPAVDGTELYTKSAGNGLPCLYVHGGPGAWSYHFEALGGSTLEAFLNMIYLDQRGCGRSMKPVSEDYRLDTVVDDFEAVRKAYGYEKWIVMAHSFGGILAVHYAMRYPERVTALILTNCTLCMPLSLQHQTVVGSRILQEMNISFRIDQRLSIIDQWYSVILPLIEHDQFYQLQYTNKEAFLKGQVIDSLLTSDQSFMNYVFGSDEYMRDFRGTTLDIQLPTLVFAGVEDHAVGPTHHSGFLFPNQEVVILPDKHVPYQENTDLWQAAILDFIHNR